MTPPPLPENPDPGGQGSDSPTIAHAVEHAYRWWLAEEENSRRISNQSRTLLTLAAAFFGLIVLRLKPIASVDPGVGEYAIKTLFSTSLVIAGIGLWRVLSVPRAKLERPMGSKKLAWPSRFVPESDVWGTLDEEQVYAISYERIIKAASELYTQNNERQVRVRAGQKALVFAILIAGAAAACYMWVGESLPGGPGLDLRIRFK